MSHATQPFFILTSDRSGAALLHEALAAADESVEMHRDYMAPIVRPLAVRRYMGWASRDETLGILSDTYGAAVSYSEAGHWGDSSTSASWLIPELAELLPSAKFVHLARDGRKVASDGFHTHAGECYDERAMALLQAYADGPAAAVAPPPEGKYWWPLPRRSDPLAAAFRRFDRFERIAWHWSEINRVILDSFARLPETRRYFVRQEELERDPRATKALLDFLDLPFSVSIAQRFSQAHEFERDGEKLLDPRQRTQLDVVAGPMLERLGYAESIEYVVNY